MEGLQQSSGLSPTVLAHALSPLTGEKGVLTTSHPDQLTQGKILQPYQFSTKAMAVIAPLFSLVPLKRK